MRGQEKHWTGILLKNDLRNYCCVKKLNLPNLKPMSCIKKILHSIREIICNRENGM